MNERSFIVKSYSAIYLFSRVPFGRVPSLNSGDQLIAIGAASPRLAHVVVASDRRRPRSKYVPAVNFKISYPALSSQRDAKQPA
jgi:hypothetical protein